ncbi:MAG: hypothetical protein Q8P08_00925 [bacterium]|nr:hypothetical protein [bacterium]
MEWAVYGIIGIGVVLIMAVIYLIVQTYRADKKKERESIDNV